MEQKSTLLDVYGNDKRIVNTARISFNKTTGDDEPLTEQDRHLIQYLIRNSHFSPIEMCQLRYIIRCPLYVARQFQRHRAFSYNERSLRYIDFPEDEVFIPLEFRSKADNVKQGSGGALPDQPDIAKTYIDALDSSIASYEELVKKGVCKEQARGVLPTSSMTEFIVEGDLRNWFNFFKLRMDSHAQKEIQDLAIEMYNQAKIYFPVTFEAFENHVLRSVTFSESEFRVIETIIDSLRRDDLMRLLAKMEERDRRILKEKLGFKE